MRLSISSSNDRLPTGNWLITWLGIGTVFLASLISMELHIRDLGWRPSVVDSPQLWVEQRKLASTLGKNAVILVGASRIQLDMDLDVMKQMTGLEPVQLAIDGTSYIPVVENLASDPSITGTIIISVNAYNMRKGKPDDVSTLWVNHYQRLQSQGIEPYRIFHNKISSYLNNLMVTHLEGAKPGTVIRSLAFGEPSSGNYLVTHSTRTRDADYRKVQMPEFYAARLKRHYGEEAIAESAESYEQFFDIYKKAISTTEPSGTRSFFPDLDNLIQLTKNIEDRGGNVIFVRFPTDKLVWEIDNKKYPKEIFWHEIKKRHSKSINFSDHSELSSYHLPDGSHLDYRDKKSFTEGLMNILINMKLVTAA